MIFDLFIWIIQLIVMIALTYGVLFAGAISFYYIDLWFQSNFNVKVHTYQRYKRFLQKKTLFFLVFIILISFSLFLLYKIYDFWFFRIPCIAILIWLLIIFYRFHSKNFENEKYSNSNSDDANLFRVIKNAFAIGVSIFLWFMIFKNFKIYIIPFITVI